MSEDCKCDNCGKVGRRRLFTLAPEGWFYAEIPYEGQTDHTVLLACSEECKQVPWQPGPGKIQSLTVDVFFKLQPRQIEDDVWKIYNWNSEEYLKGQYSSEKEALDAISAIGVRGYL